MDKIIAVDFDGTIVENNYPKLGRERIFAFQTLKALQRKGYILILWTCRTGQLLDEAINLCKANGVEFYAVNSAYPGEVCDGNTARKIDADIYIDDRNYGGIPSWGEIYQNLCPEGQPLYKEKQKIGFFSRLFKL